MSEAPQALPGLAEALQADLLRYADFIEGELVAGKPRKVGDASDCASPVMRQAASLIAQQQRNLDAALADAERYRWLREQYWFSGELCVLRNPKQVLTQGIGLGADCPSGSRLDAAIDSARAALAPGAAGSNQKEPT